MKKSTASVLFLFQFFIINIATANTELKVTYTFGNDSSFQPIMEGFEKHTGIRVIAEYSRHEDLKANMMMLIEAKKLPDAIIIPSDHAGLYKLFRYSTVDRTLFKAQISDRIWKSATINGSIYGAPLLQGNHLVLYYNKKYVTTPPKNWNDIFLQKRTFDAQGIATIEWDVEEPFYFLPFIYAYGGSPIVNGEIKLDDKNIINALNFYKELREKNIYSKECSYECAVKKFTTNELAYHINGEWQASSFFMALGANLGVSALPSIGDKKMTPSFSTYVIAFPENSLYGKKRSELIKFVDYLQSTSVQQHISNTTGAIPVEPIAFKSLHDNAKGYLKDILVLMPNTEPLPADEAMSFIWDALGKGLIRYNLDLMDSTKTAVYMQRLAERHMRNAIKKNTEVNPENL